MLKAKMGGAAPLNASLRFGGDVQSKWLGEWQVGRSYTPLDKVSRGGSSFVCVRPCTAVDPLVDVGDGVEGQYWILIAKRGEDGEPFTYDMFTEEQLEALRGPEGPQGVQGIQGIPGERGPQGVQGIQGIQGERGVQGERGERGEAFIYDDFTPEQLEALRGSEGPAGRDGNDGATFYPSVDAGGNLSWTNDVGLENPSPVNVRGPQGERGPKGDPGEGGEPEIFIATYNSTPFEDIKAAIDAGKICFCKYGTTHVFPAIGTGSNLISFMGPVGPKAIRVLQVKANDNWTATTTTLIDKAGDTMTGALTLSGDPTEDLHAATKQYVDAHAGGGTPEVFVATYGETLYEDIIAANNEGKLCVCNYNGSWHFGTTFTSTIRFTAAVAGQAVRVVSVTGFDVWEASTQTLVKKDGDSMTGYLTLHADPTNAMQAATKQYVDNKIKDIDADVTADEVTFADGQTFQQKYDSGELTGPQGPAGQNGKDGADGQPGAAGPAGADGKTPVKGTDYWTAADKTAMVNDVLAALPTWTGGSY